MQCVGVVWCVRVCICGVWCVCVCVCSVAWFYLHGKERKVLCFLVNKLLDVRVALDFPVAHGEHCTFILFLKQTCCYDGTMREKPTKPGAASAVCAQHELQSAINSVQIM